MARRRCFVCGFKSRDVVCPRCNTILRAERAVCRRCGKTFDGWVASCESCGGSTIGKLEGPTEREAVKALSSVPGITDERAKDLVGKGFRDFADVVRLALPESAVRQGVHHAIARKALLLDLVARPGRLANGTECPMCGAAWPVNATRCAVCGSGSDIDLDPTIVEEKLEEITGEIIDLTEDEDFQRLPEDLRTEFVKALGEVNPEDVLQEECRQQVEAWRRKGFDVDPLERILTNDLPHFRERSARLIRAQVMKKAESGKYRCPLCESKLEGTEEECGNCGARFS